MAILLLALSALLVKNAVALPVTTLAPGDIFPDKLKDLVSPIRVAQCRAQCLDRFSVSPLCLQSADCYMCWENCQLLESNYPVWGALCSEKSVCYPGCQQACAFHRRGPLPLSYRTKQPTQTLPMLKSRPALRTHGATVSWPAWTSASSSRPWSGSPAPASRASQPIVYVLVTSSSSDATWVPVTQTADLVTNIPEKATSMKVMVVGPEGLQAVYDPVDSSVPQENPASTTNTPPPSHAPSAPIVLDLPPQRRINTAIKPLTYNMPTAPASNKDQGWQLREVSLIHQKVLVLAELSWAPRNPGGVYLVTWEVDGGGLKGNLFTDSTRVTLSLWPDTVYHVQVELVSESKQSASLVLDTHRAVPSSSVSRSSRGPRGPTASSRIPLSVSSSVPLPQGRPADQSPADHPVAIAEHSTEQVASMHRSSVLMLALAPSEKPATDILAERAQSPHGNVFVALGIVLFTVIMIGALFWLRRVFARIDAVRGPTIADSSPFIRAMCNNAGEIVDIKPIPVKSEGVFHNAFTRMPRRPTELVPVVSLVRPADNGSAESTAIPSCQATVDNGLTGSSWRHQNMASAWTVCAHPSNSLLPPWSTVASQNCPDRDNSQIKNSEIPV